MNAFSYCAYPTDETTIPKTIRRNTMKATWNDVVLAESDDTEVVEGNHYFPPESVNRDLLVESEHQTHCPWKGDASYYDIEAEGERAENAAWFYPAPKEAAKQIEDHVAFYTNQVEITE